MGILANSVFGGQHFIIQLLNAWHLQRDALTVESILLNNVGDCFQPQCYAVDTNGNQCEFGKDSHTVQSEIDGVTSPSEGARNILSFLLVIPILHNRCDHFSYFK